MENEKELLKFLYDNANMGYYTTEKLLDGLDNLGNKINKFVEEMYNDYSKYVKQIEDLIDKKELKDINFFIKISADLKIKQDIKRDNSDSKIAEMLIQGISMGTTDIERRINNYAKDIDKEVLDLAKKYLKNLNNQIKELKKYL